MCVFSEVPYIRRISLQPNPGIMFTYAVGVVRVRVCSVKFRTSGKFLTT